MKNDGNFVVKPKSLYKIGNTSVTNDNNISKNKESVFLGYSSTFSIILISEVTPGAVEVWATLPAEIRQDAWLASFRQEHERIHGKHWNIYL